jgi:hypothetical protein
MSQQPNEPLEILCWKCGTSIGFDPRLRWCTACAPWEAHKRYLLKKFLKFFLMVLTGIALGYVPLWPFGFYISTFLVWCAWRGTAKIWEIWHENDTPDIPAENRTHRTCRDDCGCE